MVKLVSVTVSFIGLYYEQDSYLRDFGENQALLEVVISLAVFLSSS